MKVVVDGSGGEASATQSFSLKKKNSKILGTVKYWKDDTPLTDLKLSVSQSKVNASDDGSIYFRDIVRNQETGLLTTSLWASSGETGFSNINFEFLSTISL